MFVEKIIQSAMAVIFLQNFGKIRQKANGVATVVCNNFRISFFQFLETVQLLLSQRVLMYCVLKYR